MAMRTRIRHVFLLTSGWSVLAAGLIVLPIPVPMPIPVAFLLLFLGTAILSGHSRRFRHLVQHARYRSPWLSTSFESVGRLAPEGVKRMVHRTRPALVERYARLHGTRATI